MRNFSAKFFSLAINLLIVRFNKNIIKVFKTTSLILSNFFAATKKLKTLQ